LFLLNKSQILSLEGFKELSATNILLGIEASKKQPFEKVLFALGIRYVGETVAKKLAIYFQNIDRIAQASFEELKDVPEVGEVIAKSVFDFFQVEFHTHQIESLKTYGLQTEINEDSTGKISSKLADKTFVVSGVFSVFSRDELKKTIESHGGKNVGSLSKSTSFLVVGDNMGPEKKKKAESFNIQMISEQGFLKMIE
jgi:DNA ligase (NAD+)